METMARNGLRQTVLTIFGKLQARKLLITCRIFSLCVT